jgi:hypothetical protein
MSLTPNSLKISQIPKILLAEKEEREQKVKDS